MRTGDSRAKRKAEPAAPAWALSDLEFVGCDAVPMTAVEYDAYEGAGARDGMGPDDDPLLRSLRDQSRAEGRAESQAEAVRAILQSRGVAYSENLLVGIPAAAPGRVVVAAALACDSEQDFHARLRRG